MTDHIISLSLANRSIILRLYDASGSFPDGDYKHTWWTYRSLFGQKCTRENWFVKCRFAVNYIYSVHVYNFMWQLLSASIWSYMIKLLLDIIYNSIVSLSSHWRLILITVEIIYTMQHLCKSVCWNEFYNVLSVLLQK